MPSSATITSFTSFSPATPIRSAQVNSNFSIWRGHVVPVDPNTATGADNTYDLGASDNRWRFIYGRYKAPLVATAGSYSLGSSVQIAVISPTSGGSTATVTLPAVANNTGLVYLIKHAGTTATVFVDADGTELIDGTQTCNLAIGEAIEVACTGAKWIVGQYYLNTMGAMAAAGSGETLISTSGSYTATYTTDTIVIAATAGGSTATVTLPALAGNSGHRFVVKNAGTTATVFIDGDAAETIDGTTSVNIFQGDAVTLVNASTEWKVI